MACQDVYVRMVLDRNLCTERPFPVTVERACMQIARMHYSEHLQRKLRTLQGVSELTPCSYYYCTLCAACSTNIAALTRIESVISNHTKNNADKYKKIIE